MSDEGSGPGIDPEGLRERNAPLHTDSAENAKATVLDLNAKEEHADKDEKDKKTFGRTPNGTGQYFHTASPFAHQSRCPKAAVYASGALDTFRAV